MKRLILFLTAILLAAPALGASKVWVMRPGDFGSVPFSGDQAGLNAGDAYLSPYGIGQISPGLEGLTIPPYRAGTCWIWQRYDAYRIYGPPFEAWPRGIRQMRVDSLGVAITDSLTVGGTGSFAQNVTIGPGNKDLRMTNNGAVRMLDTGGTYRRIMGMGATDVIHFWPTTSGATGWDVRKFDDSDFILRVADPRTITAKDLVADSLRSTLRLTMPSYTFASLPSSPNGSVVYVTDGSRTTPCTGGGTGAFATRVNGAWDCYASGAGEANTASNVGAGTGLIFKQKTGVDLEFKSLIAGSGIGIANNASDITISGTASTDTIGVIVQPGYPGGQVWNGSNATSSGSNSYAVMRGYNNASSTGAARLKLNQTWEAEASSFRFTERGQTTGLLINTGVGFVNAALTGSLAIDGQGTSNSIDMTNWSGTAPGLWTRGKTTGSADQQQWRDPATGTKVSWIDRTGIFHFPSSGTMTTGIFDSIRVNLTSNLIGNLTTGVAGAAYTAQFGSGGAGTDGSVVRIRSGSSGGTRASLFLNRNGGDRAGFEFDGTNTFIGSTGGIYFQDFVGSINRSFLTNDGKWRMGDGNTPTHQLEVVGGGGALILDSLRTYKFTANGSVAFRKGDDVTAASTISPGDGNLFTITGTAATILTVTMRQAGTHLTFLMDEATVFGEGGNLKLGAPTITGDAAGETDVLNVVSDGTYWIKEGMTWN